MALEQTPAGVLERSPELSQAPYRTQPFRVRAPSSAAAVTPQVLFQGFSSLEFRPTTVTIAYVSGHGIDNPSFLPEIAAQEVLDGRPPLKIVPDAAQAGDVVIQLRAVLSSGAWYLRRFSLPRFRPVTLDVSSWADGMIDVLYAQAAGADVVGQVSNRVSNSKPDETLFYGESYSIAGQYLTPPGAREVYPAVADAGFTWSAGAGTIPGNVNVLDPAVVGQQKAVKGPHFTVTAAWGAIWRILL